MRGAVTVPMQLQTHAQQLQQHEIKAWRSALACLLYVGVSFSMAFLNKAVLGVYHFDHVSTVLLLQLTFTVVFLQCLKYFRLIIFEDVTLTDARALLGVSLLYALNVGISLSALSELNIPMHSALKRLTILAALLGERVILHSRPSLHIQLSVLLIAFGALVAGIGDLEFSLFGYIYAGASCIFQAAFLVLLKRAHLSQRFSSTGLVFYNALLSLPLVLLTAVISGDLSRAFAFTNDHLDDHGFLYTLFLSIFVGALLNYSMFLCTTLNSPVTLTAAGQFKAVAQTLLGLVAFGGVKISALNLIGLTMNMTGGISYAYYKHVESSTTAMNASTNEKGEDLELARSK